MRQYALFAAACLVAASFLIARCIEIGGLAQPIWKAAGIALLGAFAFQRGAPLAGTGLVASAVGDFVLDLNPPFWLGGMTAFAAAHVFYAVAFYGILQAKGRSAFGPFMATLAVIVSFGMLIWTLPGMKSLLAPGIAYHAIITLMVALALLSNAPAPGRAGAVLFLVSDAVIALELYKGLGPFGPLNWLLYAPAQALIAWGFAGAAKTRASAARKPDQAEG